MGSWRYLTLLLADQPLRRRGISLQSFQAMVFAQPVMNKKQKRHAKQRAAKSVLRLPDLEVAKSAVLNSLSCPDAQRGYRHAIDEFVLPAQNNLGLIGIQSVYGNYLQAHTDGEMHASNPHQNREETWYRYEVDASKHIYALRNFRNGLFMSKQANTCTPAVSESIGRREEWIVISGEPYRKGGHVAFQSVYDGTYLGTQVGGKDVSEGCGGEVYAVETLLNTTNPNWPGWWVVSGTPGDPGNGNDVFTAIGKVFSVIFGDIGPADVVALLASLIP